MRKDTSIRTTAPTTYRSSRRHGNRQPCPLWGKEVKSFVCPVRKHPAFFEDERLDFVFIDANHSYEACLEDIRLWFPKVKPNGVIAGHDYTNAVRSYATFGG